MFFCRSNVATSQAFEPNVKENMLVDSFRIYNVVAILFVGKCECFVETKKKLQATHMDYNKVFGWFVVII